MTMHRGRGGASWARLWPATAAGQGRLVGLDGAVRGARDGCPASASGRDRRAARGCRSAPGRGRPQDGAVGGVLDGRAGGQRRLGRLGQPALDPGPRHVTEHPVLDQARPGRHPDAEALVVGAARSRAYPATAVIGRTFPIDSAARDRTDELGSLASASIKAGKISGNALASYSSSSAAAAARAFSSLLTSGFDQGRHMNGRVGLGRLLEQPAWAGAATPRRRRAPRAGA